MKRTLLRGGSILTLDPLLGDIEGGDLLIEDDEIRAVGRNVHAPGAKEVDAGDFIVLPGFVNAHQHTWQTGIRGIAGDWTLVEYIRQMHEGFGPGFRPEDVYLANLLGALNQLNGGVTTLFDWCHNNPTPGHTDAGLDGLEEAGIRAVFGHGTPKPRITEGETPLSHRPHPPDEVRRLRAGRLAAEDGLIKLALATRGPDLSTLEMCVHDICLAREYDLLWSAHIGGDMFTMMRMGLQFARAQENQKILDGRTSPVDVAIPARRALEWATIDGANALGLGYRAGTLKPGKQADIVLIRKGDLNLFPVHDALETVVFQASFANVDTVFVAGKLVKENGKLLYPRLGEKMAALAESGRRLLH